MVASPGTAYGSADVNDMLSFQLTDPIHRNVYRFRAMSPESAKKWVQYLHDAVRGLHVKQPPTNLISFEWSRDFNESAYIRLNQTKQCFTTWTIFNTLESYTLTHLYTNFRILIMKEVLLQLKLSNLICTDVDFKVTMSLPVVGWLHSHQIFEN